MFYGREYELADLEQAYVKESFAFYVVYGRRRIGKTTLLREFSKQKNVLYFAAQETNTTLNLEKFSREIYKLQHLPESMPSFSSWEQAFLYLGEYVKDHRLLLIIDEFPYIATSDPSILSTLQHIIDQNWKDSHMFLILCGSSMSFMENEVLGYKSPLFGRRTAQLHLKPFSFYESCAMMKDIENEDKVLYYAILGGIPQYLEKIDQTRTVRDNIIDMFLKTSSYMYEEPQMLLKQELREPAVYNAIIMAIACGKTKMNEICDFVKEPASKISKYTANLIQLGLVKKDTPFLEVTEISKRGLYHLQDHMFQFWYRFVFENRDIIENKESDYLYDKKIQPHLREFCAFPFEEICREFLMQESRSGHLPCRLQKIGNWWGKDPYEKKQAEIDILATGENNMILGECKWQKEAIDLSIIDKLKTRARLFPGYKEYYFAFFGKGGFSDAVLQEAKKDKHILLFTLEDIFRES